ncbi:MAG: pilus assembly protein [Phreatobacter sp.]|nr:pilus assembly protein [Phreatobacter sp.]
MIKAITQYLRAFIGSRSGAIAPLFALCSVVLITIVGGAVDYNAAGAKKARLQNALDAGVLAGARSLELTSAPSQIETIIRNYVTSQARIKDPISYTFTIDVNQRTVVARATVNHQTSFLGLIGMNTIPVGAEAASRGGRAYVEVALVLDNSGSMAGSRITTLRTAAVNLTNKVLAAAYAPGDTKVSLVPFSSMVNVGPQNANASWMDGQGQSPIHSENFVTPANRFQLYSRMNGVSWAGCVEARPAPHDVTDTAPTSGNPATLFVPSFAPDEPDEGPPWGFHNSYIGDGGNCQSGHGTNLLAKQRRTCKYNNVTPDVSLSLGTRRGPNQMCDSTAIIPLSSNLATLTTAMLAMQAYGGTNLHEAVMWGWRVLSPGAPFTEGRAYDDPENRKFIVLMTDGQNDIIGINNMNGSMYSAYGYAAAGRLGTTSSSKAVLTDKMDEKTLAACANAKATGIRIYTVGFYVTDPDALKLLRTCASSASMALVANSDADLANAFDEIAGQITRLRLTQ